MTPTDDEIRIGQINDVDLRVKLAEFEGWSRIEDYSESLMMSEGTYVHGYPPKNAIVGKKEEKVQSHVNRS